MQSHELLRSHRAHGIEIACAVQGRIDKRQYNTNSHKQGHAYYSCDHVKHRCIIICCIVRLDSSALHIRTNNMYAIRDLNTILNCNRPQTISHKSCSIYCFFFSQPHWLSYICICRQRKLIKCYFAIQNYTPITYTVIIISRTTRLTQPLVKLKHRIGSVCHMASFMSSHRATVRKRHSTRTALVRFLTSVNSVVALQMRRGFECLIANRAHVISRSRIAWLFISLMQLKFIASRTTISSR